MSIDDYQEARDRRDLAVAEALGIDPATCANLEVDRDDMEVYWDHLGPEPYPEGSQPWLMENMRPIRLRRWKFTVDEWEKVRRADDEWRGHFPDPTGALAKRLSRHGGS